MKIASILLLMKVRKKVVKLEIVKLILLKVIYSILFYVIVPTKIKHLLKIIGFIDIFH